MDAVNDGKIHLRSNEMPTFLYDIDDEYDVEALEIGLLRSEILVRVSTIIYIFFVLN